MSATTTSHSTYQGFAVFPLSKLLQKNGLNREVSDDMKRRLLAWLSRQTCVFEAHHHEKYWRYFVQSREKVVPPQFTADVGEYVPGTVRIVHRFVEDGNLRGETIYMPADCMVLIICDMFFGETDAHSQLPPLRSVMTTGGCDALPIVLAQAVTFIARIVPDMLKWAVPTYSAINLAGGTSIDVRGLDILRSGMLPAADADSALMSADYSDRATFVIFARLVFNYVFAEMCASPSGVSEARIRVRLCHEPALFHMFCRRLSRSERITSVDVSRAVPGMCADAVSHMGLLLLNELMDCAADHTVTCYNHLHNEFKSVGSGPNIGRHGSDFAMARPVASGNTSAAMQIVQLWCSNALMYDIFKRSRDAAHSCTHADDPRWRAFCSEQRGVRVNIASVRLHTWNTAIALLTQHAHASGLWRMCSFVRQNFQHPSMAVMAQISGCTQYELFHTVARVVPRSHSGFWVSFFSQTCVVDLGVIDEEGEGVLLVCSDEVYTLLEAVILASMVCRPAASAGVPRTLEMLQVSYHIARALDVAQSASFAGCKEWSHVLWRLVVSWADATFMCAHRVDVDWSALAERVWKYSDEFSRVLSDSRASWLREYFLDKNRSKVTVTLLAHCTGILTPKFAKREYRRHVVELARRLAVQDETWLRSRGFVAFANAAAGAGAAELVSDGGLIENLLDCVLRHSTHSVIAAWKESHMPRGVGSALAEWLGMDRQAAQQMMDDGRIPAVRYGDHVEEQRLQLVCAVPSSAPVTAGALRDSDSKLLSRHRAVGAAVSPNVDSSDGSSAAPGFDAGPATNAHRLVGVLDVLLTWENIFRRPLQPRANLTGLMPSAVVSSDAANLCGMVPKWDAFLRRINYDIPYAVGTNGLCWSRRHLPFVQFMNRKVIFFDDIRTKLMCAASGNDTSWMQIEGCALWWDLEHLNNAFERRFVAPTPIPAKPAKPSSTPQVASNVYSPVYAASPMYMYSPTSPSPADVTGLNIPESYRWADSEDDDSEDDDDDDDDDARQDDHEMMMSAMTKFNQYGSHASSGHTGRR